MMSFRIILQETLNRKHNGKEYAKFRVNIPIQMARILSLRGGDVLDVRLEADEIILRRAR